MIPASSPRCLIVVGFEQTILPECEEGLRELERRSYPVRRVRSFAPWDVVRSQQTFDALSKGFEEVLWIDPTMSFFPDSVERLRTRELPLVCGLYPRLGRREFEARFLPETRSVRFGKAGHPLEIVSAGLGFVLLKKSLLEQLQRELSLPVCRSTWGDLVPWFQPMTVEEAGQTRYLSSDEAFCERVRQIGGKVIADTSIRLGRMGQYPFSWEDAGSEKERFFDYHFQLSPDTSLPAKSGSQSPAPPSSTALSPRRRSLQTPVQALRSGFPKLRAYFVSYPKNRESLELSLEDFRGSDWGEEPTVFMQPGDWAPGKDAASANYRRAMEQARADDCDFALILEDDVRVVRHLRETLCSIPLIARDQCDYFSLFMPDLVTSPWERQEPHLGYRLAKPLYSGPNRLWERSRIWGSQAYLLSRRFLDAALERWDRLREGQDTRVISICAELKLPMWYSCPCLVEHEPLRSAFGTPSAKAPDFRADFRLELSQGFQPPEEVPGWLTYEEAETLYQMARDRTVLEMGTAFGRSTVCLGQQARRVLSIDRESQEEASEWAARYGLRDRIEFRRGDMEAVLSGVNESFDLIFIDSNHDAPSVRRDIELALPRLTPGGLLAFHDYPDPGWPDVRRVVDEYALRHQWQRVAQANFLGVFAVHPSG